MSKCFSFIYILIQTLLLPNNTIQVCFEKLVSNGFETFVPEGQTKYIKRFKYCVEQIKVPENKKIKFIFNKNQIKKDEKCLIEFFIFKETDNTKSTFRCKKGIPPQYLSFTNHLTVSYKTVLYTTKPIVYTLNYTILTKEQSTTKLPTTQVVTKKETTVKIQATKYITEKTETNYITEKTPTKYITEQASTKHSDRITINQRKTLKTTKAINSFSVMTKDHSINKTNTITLNKITKPDTDQTNGTLPQAKSTSQTLTTDAYPSLVYTLRQKSTTNIKKSINKDTSSSQSEDFVSTSTKSDSTNIPNTTGNEYNNNQENEISVMESSKQSRMIASNMRLAIVFVMGTTSFLFLVDLILYTRQRGFFFTIKETLCADTKDLERIQLIPY